MNINRALKVVKKSKYKSPLDLKVIRNDLAVMKLIDHPNIVKLFDFYEDEYNLYLITEYCTGG